MVKPHGYMYCIYVAEQSIAQTLGEHYVSLTICRMAQLVLDEAEKFLHPKGAAKGRRATRSGRNCCDFMGFHGTYLWRNSNFISNYIYIRFFTQTRWSYGLWKIILLLDIVIFGFCVKFSGYKWWLALDESSPESFFWRLLWNHDPFPRLLHV